jgi:hypothetical protein
MISKYPELLNKLNKILNKEPLAKAEYAWGVISGIDLANSIGLKKVSVIEFGVAGGNGLVSLEKIAKIVEDMYPIEIEVYGFDTGKGLPKPTDTRDLPHLWTEGSFKMDVENLKSKLTKAKLILGDVKDTIKDFISSNPAPVAFISFDLDFYTSTQNAFAIFEENSILLPRIHCYFDDIMGYSFSDFNGERLAISDFNNKHENKKISKIYGLKFYLHRYEDIWIEKYYMVHIFDHELYSKNDGMLINSELPLTCTPKTGLVFFALRFLRNYGSRLRRAFRSTR